MKKTLLASLGLTLLLSTSASVAVAEEANSVPAAKESTFAPLLEYNEQEPNDTFEQANYYFIGDAVIGTLGEEKHGMWENYDVYKIMAENKSSEVHFTIQGHRYPDSWLELTLFDSNGQSIKSSKNGQYFLNATLEQGKDYYLTVNALGLQYGGKMFDYKLSSEAVR
ncbi:hypothetical protein MKN04_03655 [Paenibacillus polymyxa]|uniref:hypothetical protein n=1 Tax=Paenibacillus polymyxa TaxID=1406 RepID=UPI0004D73953|nr:hypothetical protein [Paenibacillus polymyxa]KEO80634.1 hypothetical protein EL23_03660 [Paenibacillus polymyxa]MCH6186755.1 hypothetical protein [Paenibacillus polymyxa]MDY8092058.1 hypothetical protein [Paenibacillus polymyxa]WRL60269.1 hypothetical protein U3G77_19325 [Paenibacillus polymyxa]